jgi:hypothetical protein
MVYRARESAEPFQPQKISENKVSTEDSFFLRLHELFVKEQSARGGFNVESEANVLGLFLKIRHAERLGNDTTDSLAR